MVEQAMRLAPELSTDGSWCGGHRWGCSLDVRPDRCWPGVLGGQNRPHVAVNRVEGEADSAGGSVNKARIDHQQGGL